MHSEVKRKQISDKKISNTPLNGVRPTCCSVTSLPEQIKTELIQHINKCETAKIIGKSGTFDLNENVQKNYDLEPLRFTSGLILPHNVINNNVSINAIEKDTLGGLLSGQDLLNGKSRLHLQRNFSATKSYAKIRNLSYSKNICNRQDDDIILIDCRFGYEFKKGHIKNSFNVSDPRVLEHIFFKNPSYINCREFRLLFKNLIGTSVSIEKFDQLKKIYKKMKAKESSKGDYRSRDTLKDQIARFHDKKSNFWTEKKTSFTVIR